MKTITHTDYATISIFLLHERMCGSCFSCYKRKKINMQKE